MTAANPALAHPRIQERRDAVEDAETRRRTRRLAVLGGVVVLALLAALATQTPLLDVNEVRVIGATATAPERIRAIAGIEPGAALVGLDLAEAEARVSAVPRVAAVDIERTWGGLVTVTIEERRAVARIATAEGILVVAADGLVLERTEEPDTMLTEIGGAMFSTPVGDVVPVELADAVAVAASLPSDIGRVTERVIVGQDRVALELVGGGVVELGDARDVDAKYDAVRALLGQVELACLERIDVRAATVPVLARGGAC